ncbi:tryptophan synthase subunit alpha [Legionella taurinensis]|uniref:Tryptophan synthase alpha chain n=1 Tax=Legionella taurinensis TaxID=70611 RepID=A0A3A5L809_9GAMM|nr:tryptophan synthase subunit alpha [Legionella taurinensis]MDX1837134.1 tryptophan synthase subunit alpha [Legionella taurinensis]PUT40384.1 tryptophan synthase subunit alpha [Legionella taurinensis]PUT40525.1 tryptophan synthase subunit alpha [Legionella taurinensis]PUT42770.1 tryptophan synthase subunit alpha [Legionella taurinensis]PUT48445.1 tryptophan synthase subunit alpha [Legionella taurinensis]
MNRIDACLKRLQDSNKKALSPYITAGDLQPERTVELMHALVKAGADILEIGIPFSDPMAEGPVIQAAMERSLNNGTTLKTVLQYVTEFRQTDDTTPIILMGYVNPVETHGYERFAREAKAAGADGTILVDLPPEESEEVAKIWQESGLYMIYLCSPTTSDERMVRINHFAQGYLYYVSLKGVTGASSFALDEVRKHYQHRHSQTRLPLMVGFGIKTAEMAAQVADFADGVIVGAALVERLFDSYTRKDDYILPGVTLIADMRRAIDE